MALQETGGYKMITETLLEIKISDDGKVFPWVIQQDGDKKIYLFPASATTCKAFLREDDKDENGGLFFRRTQGSRETMV